MELEANMNTGLVQGLEDTGVSAHTQTCTHILEPAVCCYPSKLHKLSTSTLQTMTLQHMRSAPSLLKAGNATESYIGGHPNASPASHGPGACTHLAACQTPQNSP
eukprot:1161287-Pelagomonas_calceolata.AAC.5